MTDVRIKYIRDGEERISGLLTLAEARRLVGHYEGAVIVLDEEGWPEWEGEG